MSKFKAPSNIKQIGNIDEKIKIYIEDYAYTYLQQYATAGNYNERLAFLIGKNINDGDKNVILISGAVCSKYTQHSDGILNITNDTWNYVYEQIQRYFNGLEVVGLMQSQPGYGTYLNEKYVSQFRNNFNKLYQTFLLCDPIENLNVFHVFDSMREKLNPIKGYFIYYQKNEAMNEYMIENKEAKQIISEEETQKEEPPEITIRKRQFERIKKSNNDQRKIVNMLASLSAVLFLICFIMGTGLVQNEERISKLESQLQTLNITYKKNNFEEKTASVFSAQETPNIIKQNESDKNNSPLPSLNLDNDILEDEKEEKDDKELQTPQNIDETEQVENKKQIPKTYTVQSGDSLSGISKKIFGDSSMVNKIMELNDMDNPDTIYIGKVLKLPREF